MSSWDIAFPFGRYHRFELGAIRFPLIFVGPLQRVRPRNGILALVLVLPLRSEFIGEL